MCLYEMLYNIADNAVRYTNPGWTYSYLCRQKQRGKRPFYRVEDDGIGIPKSEQKRIFERFYRVDKSHSRQTGGTGLGLSIVKHGATLHHAQIQCGQRSWKRYKNGAAFLERVEKGFLQIVTYSLQKAFLEPILKQAPFYIR